MSSSMKLNLNFYVKLAPAMSGSTVAAGLRMAVWLADPLQHLHLGVCLQALYVLAMSPEGTLNGGWPHFCGMEVW